VVIFSSVWHGIRRRLEAGELPTWLREARHHAARTVLFAETAGMRPETRAQAHVVYLGPGAHQTYAAAYLAFLERPGAPWPAVPEAVTPRQAAKIRLVLEELTEAHRWRV
jgi:hypothetical protein